MRKSLSAWMLLTAMPALAGETAPTVAPTKGLILWDAGYTLITKGVVAYSAEPDVGKITIRLRPSPTSSISFADETRSSELHIIPTVPFEHTFHPFWGGTRVEGETDSEKPEFLIEIAHTNGKCTKLVVAPTAEEWRSGGLTVDFGLITLKPKCPLSKRKAPVLKEHL